VQQPAAATAPLPTTIKGGGDRWRTPIQGEIHIADDELESRKAPNTHLGYDEKVDAVVGGGAWRAGPPPSIHRLMDTDPRSGLHSMWRTGGGKAGYEELRQPEITEDPLLRLFARCDEIEQIVRAKGSWTRRGERLYVTQKKQPVYANAVSQQRGGHGTSRAYSMPAITSPQPRRRIARSK